MRPAKRISYIRVVLAPVFVVFSAGCGEGHARYTPTANEARSSLEAALTAWRAGKPYGPVDSTPPVTMVDSIWQNGQELESFEIGDQQNADDGTKQFLVKIKLKKAKGSDEIRYVVNGRDPVWVYREDDYKRTLNMDNSPIGAPQPKSTHHRPSRSR